MPEKAWGVIYCPKDGNPHKTGKRWKRIRAYLDRRGVSYDFVQSDGAGAVERLAAMMTRNGYETVVVVGGDSALNHAVCGVMATPVPPGGRRPALGVIPNGYGNDFARFWGIDTNDCKAAVDTLILHRKRRVDVGTALLTGDGGEEERLHFLNCCNVGVVSAITGLRRRTRSFLVLKTLSYLLSSLLLLFQRMSFRFRFEMSGESHERGGMNLCVGSAKSYGLTPSAVPYNGLLDVTLVSKPQTRQLLHGLWLLYTNRFLSHRGVSVWRTRHIRLTGTGHAPVSVDGRVVRKRVRRIDIGILPEELDFIVPAE